MVPDVKTLEKLGFASWRKARPVRKKSDRMGQIVPNRLSFIQMVRILPPPLIDDFICPVSQAFACQQQELSCRGFRVKVDFHIGSFFLRGIFVVDLYDIIGIVYPDLAAAELP